MTAHPAIAAVPKTGAPSRALLQALLVTRVAIVLGDAESPDAFDPRGEDGAIATHVIGYRGVWFWLDEADATTGHDGVTCIVTAATGGRYKATGIDLLITHVKSKTLVTPPDPDDVDEEARPVNGDSYLIPVAATGAWANKTNWIATWVEARREWFLITPKPGWFVWLAGATQDIAYHYDSVQAAWITGLGGGLQAASSVPLSAIIGTKASLILKVENDTAYAPPGSRKTGATPAMPKGGTATAINDNDDATSAVTGALGNLSGASVADRIVARLTLAAATNLIAIEARGVLGSVASSADAMGLYWSANNGAAWTQAGAGFTLGVGAANVMRTGAFAGVTDIALVTEAKNWAAATNTLGGLNAFDATVTAAVGDAWIIAPNPIGIFAGKTNQVAICETVNTLTMYQPSAGDFVFSKAVGRNLQFRDGAWLSATGRFRTQITAFTASGVFAKDARCFQAKVTVISSGGSTAADGGSASFGAHCSATGGGAGGGALGGVGSGGDLNFVGERPTEGSRAGFALGQYGRGGDGGGGGAVVKVIAASALAANVAVTINITGMNNGFVLVEEYIED